MWDYLKKVFWVGMVEVVDHVGFSPGNRYDMTLSKHNTTYYG